MESTNSRKSIWCKYELNYFSELKRPIYCININDISSKNWEDMYIIEDMWYYDSNYKEYPLIKNKIISENS